MSNKREVSTMEQKIEWLLAHRHLLALLGRDRKRRIVLAMKHDGLVAKSTYWPDVTRIEEAIRRAKLKALGAGEGRKS